MATGSITVTPGKVFNALAGERVDLPKLNQLGVPTARVDANTIGRRELITSFVEQVDDTTASYEDLLEIVVTGEEALVSRVDILEVSMTDAATDISANATAIDGLQTTVTNLDGDIEATAAALLLLQAEVGDVSAAVVTEASARASADGAIHARWGVNLNANNRVIGRINLDGTNATSTLDMEAATIRLWNGSTAVAPFLLSGGVVYMQNVVVSGTLIAGTISAVTLNSVIINSIAGSIAGFTLAANSMSSGSGASRFVLDTGGSPNIAFGAVGSSPASILGSAALQFANSSGAFSANLFGGDSGGGLELYNAAGGAVTINMLGSTGSITATSFSGSGGSLTSLNASNIASGTIDNARLPGTIDIATAYKIGGTTVIDSSRVGTFTNLSVGGAVGSVGGIKYDNGGTNYIAFYWDGSNVRAVVDGSVQGTIPNP